VRPLRHAAVAREQHQRHPAPGVAQLLRQQRGNLQRSPLHHPGVGAFEAGDRGVLEAAGDGSEPLVAGGRGGDHGDPEPALQFTRLHVDAEVQRFVLQVQDEQLPPTQLAELDSEVEGTPQVLGVADLKDHRIGLGEQQVARDSLVIRLRSERVGARGVDDLGRARQGDRTAAGDLDRRPWIVRNRHVGSGEGAEDHALADVGVPDQEHWRRGEACGEVRCAAHVGGRGSGQRTRRHTQCASATEDCQVYLTAQEIPSLRRDDITRCAGTPRTAPESEGCRSSAGSCAPGRPAAGARPGRSRRTR
jgi:hypothetical protein